MITEWFVSLGTGTVGWFLSLFGTADPPAFITAVGTFIAGILESAAGLGAWIPWALVLTIAGVNLALWGIGLTVRVVRWLVGLIPTMGGG